MNAYPPIADQRMVGDLQTAALVSSEQTIDRAVRSRTYALIAAVIALDEAEGSSAGG
ncbi:hypothetical protein HW130_25190 [Streptomyces sp. PKU-EA00015]|uniref:hypothetical protein n=1 Tax=Streptomyces sp. PKU-EA00015 TaxID=2748326 RepID=UPI0015A10F3C|nr:hypothetical protein [Streptomyces sp. PKU-EA00015]NWF29509.1 hypothetical protein [Streptomyces sp. PKU-EA00015]